MIPLDFQLLSESEMRSRSEAFSKEMKKRRSVRNFSDRPLPEGIIENCLTVAGSAPSGANLQPWHFAVVRSAKVKRVIREGAEKEEREFYGGRAPQEWLDSLAKFGTGPDKPFLESAPVLIAIFQKLHVLGDGGNPAKAYYPKESVGIATGFLIAALHHAGLATLTHTPSPMRFLNEFLGRPPEDKPFLLLVVGYPANDCEVPQIGKKPLGEITSYH